MVGVCFGIVSLDSQYVYLNPVFRLLTGGVLC